MRCKTWHEAMQAQQEAREKRERAEQLELERIERQRKLLKALLGDDDDATEYAQKRDTGRWVCLNDEQVW